MTIERRVHSFSWPGIAGGHIEGGRDGRPNGDRILLDFAHRFFAVSDSSDRNPASSRKCLLSFAAAIGDRQSSHPEEEFSDSEPEALRHEFIRLSNAVLAGLKENAACTFTGIHIIHTASGPKGLLMHTGDSALYRCSPDSKRIRKLTHGNFWMVGKTNRLFQVDWIDLCPDDFLLLTTDGIFDLDRQAALYGNHGSDRVVYRHPVEAVPRELILAETARCGLKDDAAAMSLQPLRLQISDRKILIEGT